MGEKSFVHGWLSAAKITDDPAGDLVADMRRDAHLPSSISNFREMRHYLIHQGACREALEAAPIVWRRYRNWRDRHPVSAE